MAETVWIDIARIVTLISLSGAALALVNGIIWVTAAGKRTIDEARQSEREASEIISNLNRNNELGSSDRRRRQNWSASDDRGHLISKALAARSRRIRAAE